MISPACTTTRARLLDYRRGTLPPAARAEVEAHLVSCPACRHEDAADQELSLALAQRLPFRRAPKSLRDALGARYRRPRRRVAPGPVLRWASALAAGAIVCLLVLVAIRPRPNGGETLVSEAVNDHLRVLYSQHPIEIESGGIHQVKPWFEGRLDFAPVTAFAGDDDFPLQGGSIAYFVDRKAAAFIFKRRLHVISLFEFSALGLEWPAFRAPALPGDRGAMTTRRGFHVLLWREGDLGYALVSDVDEQDLRVLATRITPL